MTQRKRINGLTEMEAIARLGTLDLPDQQKAALKNIEKTWVNQGHLYARQRAWMEKKLNEK